VNISQITSSGAVSQRDLVLASYLLCPAKDKGKGHEKKQDPKGRD
jgi:hypothetical protein